MIFIISELVRSSPVSQQIVQYKRLQNSLSGYVTQSRYFMCPLEKLFVTKGIDTMAREACCRVPKNFVVASSSGCDAGSAFTFDKCFPSTTRTSAQSRYSLPVA